MWCSTVDDECLCGAQTAVDALLAGNLEAYVQERAAQLAKPVIARVQCEADARVAGLELELAAAAQRFADLQKEFRRIDKARDGRLARLTAELDRLRAAAGER